MLHCDLRVRWKVASDLRFRAAISEPKTPSFCGISGDLARSTRKSLAIAIVRFWCAKNKREPKNAIGGLCPTASPRRPPVTIPCAFRCSEGVCDAALLALRYCMVWCMFCLVCLAVPLLSCKRGWAKRRNNPVGVPAIVFFFHISYCVLGAVPMVGRRLRLSVPWSPKTTLREEGRPMGPATPRAFDSSG